MDPVKEIKRLFIEEQMAIHAIAHELKIHVRVVTRNLTDEDYNKKATFEAKEMIRKLRLFDELRGNYEYQKDCCKAVGIAVASYKKWKDLVDELGEEGLIQYCIDSMDARRKGGKAKRMKRNLISSLWEKDFKHSMLWNRYLTNNWSNLSAQ